MSGFAWTWTMLAVVLVLMGARAWVVETNAGRLSRPAGAQRSLTAAVVAALVVLVLLAGFNGGFQLVGMLTSGQTDVTAPSDVATTPTGGGAGNPAAPAGQPAGN